jgi:transcriptional regulator with XRE-family HTH domain
MVFRIREIRESKGITQLELSEKSGVTRATLWRLETSDDCDATTITLAKIANALEVPVADLFLAKNA